MSEVEQRFQQRGRDAHIGLAKLATMMSSEPTENWKSEAINQLQEVVNGLNESTRTANSIEEVNAALDGKDTGAFFDERTRRFDIKYDEEFDTQEE